MYRWLLAFVLGSSFTVNAEPVKLIPIHTPQPVYPPELRFNGITGQTKVKFVVNSDGMVSDVKVIKSSNWMLTRASRKAVRTWRFRPWVATADQPSTVEVVAPMIFGMDGAPRLPMDINVLLERLPCSTVNAQVDRRKSGTKLHELSAFSYLSRYLSEGVATSQLSDAERKELLGDFDREIPQIVERCRSDPDAYYVEKLPASIRALL